MSDTPFNLSLPDDESYIETVPIADEFSITAELPTMEGIIRYMEKEALAPHGYYRLVKHPYNRAVELNFEKEYSFKEAILYCSAQSALRELLDLLQSQLKFETLSVMPTAPMRQRHWEKRFSRLQIKSTFDINFAEEAGVVIYKFHEKPESTKICIYYSESFDSPDKIPTDTDYAIIALPGDEGAVLITN